MSWPGCKCVMVVDDDRDIREAYADALTDEGYLVTQAVDGKDALAKLTAADVEPCLVLLDMMMPRMTGAELLEVLDKTHRLASLPVVVVSATASTGEAKGARKMVRKPVPLAALIALVVEFCGVP